MAAINFLRQELLYKILSVTIIYYEYWICTHDGIKIDIPIYHTQIINWNYIVFTVSAKFVSCTGKGLVLNNISKYN